MLLTIALFELRKRLRWPSTWIYFGVFFALSVLMMLVAGGAFNGARASFGSGGKVFANAPYALALSITSISYFGLLVVSSVTGQAVHQDFENNTYALFFTSPVKPAAYLGGRFLGALLVLVLIFSSIGLGLRVGAALPWVVPELVGPNRGLAYLQPYLLAVLPNLLMTGALFFSVATLSRRMFPVYVVSVLLLVGYLIAINLTQKIENKTLAALVDPFGMNALDTLTQYWTVDERNTRLTPLSGVYLWNRLLWMGVGLGFLGFTFARFRFSHASGAEGGRAPAAELPEAAAQPVPVPVAKVSPPRPLSLLPRLTWLAFRETVKNVYFVVIVLAGVLFMCFASQNLGSLYGTSTYPVTYSLLEFTGGSFSMFILIIITFYAGDLVWRERDAKVDQLFDALPLPTWLPFASKLLALMLIQVVLMAVVMATSILIQLSKGYFHFELALYLKDLFGLRLVRYLMLCVLAITVQSVVQQKYVGHSIMVLYYVASGVMRALGFEHNLYKFGNGPRVVYSDMNKYGHFLQGAVFFDLYWGAVAILLAVAARLLWSRGVELDWRARMSQARRQLSRPIQALTAASAAAAVGLGGFIYYNTNILNPYRTNEQEERRAADYEKTYKHLADAPQPRITGVKVAADIFPAERAVRLKGTLTLENKTGQPLSTVRVRVTEEAIIHRLAVGAEEKAAQEDRPAELLTYALKQPLAPGAQLPLEFDLEYRHRGFANESTGNDLVYNGTFLNSTYIPALGYDRNRELTEDNDRRKYGLQPRERMADVNDAQARMNTYLGKDSDWITYEATVSTSPDQVALTPGYLQREWTENGRRYFHYKADGKILNFYSFLSARYVVKRDAWNGLPIEIYYHPGHEYNVDRMMEGVKASLGYFTTQFGPYQHRQVRILEFPRYRTFAQSFPNTIPFSENIGFIAKVDPKNEEDVDYPYYITAHEVAHQWWAHQVIGGDVQGATVMSETLAQYSALMVMKQKYGADKMKRFLRYELDRYLVGRGLERKKELPLARVENQQYIHYNKGSMVMYALQDFIGEEKLNQALAAYVKAVAFQGPPFTNSTELIGYLRKATPLDMQYLIDDLFESITLYENRAVAAKYTDQGGGRYEVVLDVEAKKLRADELGKEKEVALNDLVDIGVLDETGKVLFLEKRRLHSAKESFTMTVDAKPAKAGIDPLNKLIDRQPDDNVVAVTKAE